MPGDRVEFLSVDEAIAVHERLIERFGGQSGLRDQGLLESVLFRPRTGCYEDLSGMAAALFDSLLFNHAYVDGNKRLAFFATDVFLRLNGWRFDVETDNAYNFIIDLIEKSHDQRGAILPLIRRSIRKL